MLQRLRVRRCMDYSKSHSTAETASIPRPRLVEEPSCSAGWYADRGLDVDLISPHTDGYKTTPAQRLASGTADVAVAPTESVISSITQPADSTKPRLKARPGQLACARRWKCIKRHS